MTWALAGSLIYILAYGFYMVASRFPASASGASLFMLEFGVFVMSLALFAAVLGTCLMPPAREEGVKGDRPPSDKND